VSSSPYNARFDREAKTLAVLNHPNIAAIYGLERAGGEMALVMEMVEGLTLADRIAQGAVHPDEAIRIARQIAEALEAAHEQSIVHRDLEPANVKLRPDGLVASSLLWGSDLDSTPQSHEFAFRRCDRCVCLTGSEIKHADDRASRCVPAKKRPPG
jgi:serine/threonine protein kinase